MSITYTDNIFRYGAPTRDFFQGFLVGGEITGVAQSMYVPAGIEVTTLTARLARWTDAGSGGVVTVTIHDGDNPEGALLATSNSLTIGNFTDIADIDDGELVPDMQTVTFPNPWVSDGRQVTFTFLPSGGTNVCALRGRSGAYAGGQAWVQNSSFWEVYGTGDVELPGASDFELVIVTTGLTTSIDMDVTISFEGLWLKGYCYVYPCQTRGGPTEVVLSCIPAPALET